MRKPIFNQCFLVKIEWSTSVFGRSKPWISWKTSKWFFGHFWIRSCLFWRQDDCFWSKYSDVTRPHPKWWFSKGNPLISGKSRLVKYYNLARLGHWVHAYYIGLVITGAWENPSSTSVFWLKSNEAHLFLEDPSPWFLGRHLSDFLDISGFAAVYFGAKMIVSGQSIATSHDLTQKVAKQLRKGNPLKKSGKSRLVK